jgi:hypothetical protein
MTNATTEILTQSRVRIEASERLSCLTDRRIEPYGAASVAP